MKDLNEQQVPPIEEIKGKEDVDLGTFKSVKTLKEAYDNLRKVFTKNAMELSRLKQENSNKEKLENKDTEENINQVNNENSIESLSDKDDTPDNTADKVSTPAKFWESEEWGENVKSFFEKNIKARAFIQEIGQVLIEDKSLETVTNPLEKAWINVLEKQVQNKTLTKYDMEQYVLNNQEIKNRIIQDYLSKLNHKQAPSVIDKVGKTSLGAESRPHALSIEEAKEMAKKILIK